MIFWVFTAMTLIAAWFSAFSPGIHRATLALWLTGLGMGGIYITIGAEVLAIVQWIVSTLVAVSFVFFSVMFGEYQNTVPLLKNKRVLSYVLAPALGVAFASVIWLGSRSFLEDLSAIPTDGSDLKALGKSLVEDHLLSLEVLALTLFLTLVGGGVIARPERSELME